MGTILRYPFRPQEGTPAHAARQLADLEALGWQLTSHGFQHPDQAARRNEHWGSSPDPRQVALSRAWIQTFALPRKTLNPAAGSYTLKHAVEDWLKAESRPDYIAAGAFIRAAIELGYCFEQGRHGRGLNAWFYMGLYRKQRGAKIEYFPVASWPEWLLRGRVSAERSRR